MNKCLDDFTLVFRNKAEEFLQSTRDVSFRLGTLGAEGTTSSMAAKYMKSVLTENNTSVDIAYFDTFEIVQKSLLSGEIEYALVPNAYEGVTNFYWDASLTPVFYFIHDTPRYGIYTLPSMYKEYSELLGKEHLRIAACPAVYTLINKLLPEIDIDHLEIVYAPSTESAANHVSRGLCDLGVTNETSASKYNLSNITDIFRVEMSWVVFKANN
ncbi:MAG: hypothetical protein ACM3QZ_00190 [Solirubrobacterales bacterium]